MKKNSPKESRHKKQHFVWNVRDIRIKGWGLGDVFWPDGQYREPPEQPQCRTAAPRKSK